MRVIERLRFKLKKLILMTALFSITLTVITILKHESKRIELRIQEAKDLENKLKYDLSFLKVEWGLF